MLLMIRLLFKLMTKISNTKNNVKYNTKNNVKYNTKNNVKHNRNYNKSTDGYIYVMSNYSMPGLLKIGMTTRNPETRLLEANSPKTWIPTNFNLELAKKVNNPKQKEKTLHIILEKFTERTNSTREFFRVSIEIVNLLFDLIDGEIYNNNNDNNNNNNNNMVEKLNYWNEEDDIC